MSELELFTLGPPVLKLDGNSIKLPRRKALAILIYLKFSCQSRPREELAAFFWPEEDRDEGYAYLRQTLWEINKLLGEGWLLADRETVGINPGRDFWLDAEEFQHQRSSTRTHGHPTSLVCAKCVDALSRLAELYQGDFLTGFTLRNNLEFDNWQSLQAETLRREFIEVLGLLQGFHEQRDELEQALAYTIRRVRMDPLNEDAQRTLMQLYFQTGQRNAALRQYMECSRTLKEELNISPETATTHLYEYIRRSNETVRKKDASQTAVQELPALTTQPARVKIPTPTIPFVGRKDELAEVAQLINNPACHLLTLLGPGGVGKTRLAIQTAQDQREAFPQGVFYIPLVQAQSVMAMIQAILEAFDMSPHFNEPADEDSLTKTLMDYLLLKKVLLILDNFEHLSNGASVIGEMIANAPDLKIIVTSRQRLNLAGEWVKEIHGMSYPGDETHKKWRRSKITVLCSFSYKAPGVPRLVSRLPFRIILRWSGSRVWSRGCPWHWSWLLPG